MFLPCTICMACLSVSLSNACNVTNTQIGRCFYSFFRPNFVLLSSAGFGFRMHLNALLFISSFHFMPIFPQIWHSSAHAPLRSVRRLEPLKIARGKFDKTTGKLHFQSNRGPSDANDIDIRYRPPAQTISAIPRRDVWDHNGHKNFCYRPQKHRSQVETEELKMQNRKMKDRILTDQLAGVDKKLRYREREEISASVVLIAGASLANVRYVSSAVRPSVCL